MAGGWRRLHNEELRNLYALQNIITVVKSRRMGCAGNVACMRTVRNSYKMLVRKYEEKRPLARPRRR